MAQGLHWHQTGGGHGEHDSWRNAERKRALTPDHYVVTIIDLQPHRLFGVGNFDRSSIINNNLISIAGGRAGFPMPDPCEPRGALSDACLAIHRVWPGLKPTTDRVA